MLHDLANTAPASIRLKLVHLICHTVKGIDTFGEKVMMRVKEQGVVKEVVDGDEVTRTSHCRRIAADAREISERERDGAQRKERGWRPGAVHRNIRGVDGSDNIVSLELF